jgi:hypothetical protein
VLRCSAVQFASCVLSLTAVTTAMRCGDERRADMNYVDEVPESMDEGVPAAARTAQGVNR